MAKLAFWRTIGAAYAFVFGRPLRLLRIAGIWLAAILLYHLFARSIVEPIHRVMPHPMATWVAILGTVVLLVAASIYLVASVTAFTVALHRAILVGEIRSFFALPRLRRRGWRFIGYGFVVSILMGLPGLLLMFVVMPALSASKLDIVTLVAWIFLLEVGFLVAVWTYGSSLMLVFPAIAADEEGEILERAWRRAGGNRLRLFLGSILCALPFIMLGWLTSPLFVLVMPAARPVVALLARLPFPQAIGSVLEFFELAVLIAFYSFCYRQLASAAPAPGAASPQTAPAE